MKIGYATDFSKGAEAARAQVIRLAQALGSEVIPLYVVPPATVFGDESADDYVTRLYEIERKLAEEKLEGTAAAFRAAGLRVRPLVRLGVPAEQIVQVASDEGAEFIVVSTHGRGAVGQFFVGGVANRVVQTAPCAVVTVRAVDGGAAGSTGSRPVARSA